MIRALAMDVDGTLTDGKLHIGSHGEIYKTFDVKDGYAIHNMLPTMGIIPIIITGRKSEIVEWRCKELGISYVVQGSSDKLHELKKILAKESIKAEETAYIGDDLNDLICMKAVGLKGCPKDAVEEIRAIADFVSHKNGGDGAIREFVEWIMRRTNCDD